MNIITVLAALMLMFALCGWNPVSYEKPLPPPSSITQSPAEHYIVTPDAIIYPQCENFEYDE